MDTLLNTETPSKRLGFNKLETAEIVSKLDETLCNLQMFYHKLQNFHWNVVGNDFYDVHEVTESMYERIKDEIDDIAERIRVFGRQPISNISEAIEKSEIKESSSDKSAEYMVAEIVKDIELITEKLLTVHEVAAKDGDIATTYMASKLVKYLETEHWKLSSWLDNRFNS